MHFLQVLTQHNTFQWQMYRFQLTKTDVMWFYLFKHHNVNASKLLVVLSVKGKMSLNEYKHLQYRYGVSSISYKMKKEY